MWIWRSAGARRRWGLAGSVVLAALAAGTAGATGGAGATARVARPHLAAVAPIGAPTKAMCKQSHYKIGYDVFSGSQPFAQLVTEGLVQAAAKIGCVQVLKTIDNLNGPVAVGNLKTLVNEGIQGFVDFQVLAPYQPAIAKELSSAHIPGVAIVGANLPGSPNVGASNYGAAYQDGLYMAGVAKQRFPGQLPYLLGGAEPSAGAIVLERYHGAVAGEEKVFPHLPASHVIEVMTDGTETTAFSNTESALSAVPPGGVVLLTGVNDEVTGGMFKAAEARGVKNFLVNSFGGDPYGLGQVCSNPTHYVGALYLEPMVWGQDALSVILDEINHVATPHSIGIVGEEVTRSTPFLHCK